MMKNQRILKDKEISWNAESLSIPPSKYLISQVFRLRAPYSPAFPNSAN